MSAVALPQLDRTAQSFALGNDGATLTGVNALGVNPAGLYTPHAEILMQYQQLPLQTNLGMLRASLPLPSFKTTLAVSYANLYSSNFDRRDENGNAMGNFATQDQMIGLHVSRPVELGVPMTVGLSVKYLDMAVDAQHGSAMAFDVGGRWTMARWPLTLGLSAVNLGRGPSLGGQRSDLPTSYILSAAYPVASGLDVLGNLARQADVGAVFNVGAQYWIGDIMAVRGSFAMAENSAGHGVGVQGLAAGIGFKIMGKHTLDYTFQPYDSSLMQAGAAGTHRVTLTMRFAGPAAERPGEAN